MTFYQSKQKKRIFFSDRTRPTVTRIQLLNMLVDGILTKFFFFTSSAARCYVFGSNARSGSNNYSENNNFCAFSMSFALWKWQMRSILLLCLETFMSIYDNFSSFSFRSCVQLIWGEKERKGVFQVQWQSKYKILST